MHEILMRIYAPHFCAGIVMVDDTVIDAAPIVYWMLGKDWRYVKAYCKRKGWEIKRTPNIIGSVQDS